MRRRNFLRSTLGGSVAAAGGLTVGQSFIVAAVAAPAQPGASPYGPLQDPNPDGLRLPAGFTSRVIARSLLPVDTLPYIWKPFPDGATTFATDDGGWILVVNSENPPPAVDIPLPIDEFPTGFPVGGGVGAIRFASDGSITDAYEILSGSRSNCAGGATPWGTWLSAEEFEAKDPFDIEPYDGGVVYECDPTAATPPVILDNLGHFKHENAAVDPDTGHVYLSEDLPDGLLYRYTPESFTVGQRPDFTKGKLEAASLAANGSGTPAGAAVTWVAVPDPAVVGGTPCRTQGSGNGATTFDGGEGCVLDRGSVFLTTKNDDRVWEYVIASSTMRVLYDGQEFADNDTDRILRGVDHVNVQPSTGNLVIGEDGGNLEAVMIDRETNAVFPIIQMTGVQHGTDNPTPLPVESEITGLTFNPAGDRLYFNSQRGFAFGLTYEISGPFDLAVDNGSGNGSGNSSTTTTSASGGGTTSATLPVTGSGSGSSPALIGLGALGAAAVAWRARRAGEPSD